MCSTYQHIPSVSQIQQRQSAECPPVHITAFGGSHLSIPTDWMDGINTPGNFDIPTTQSLLELDLESEKAR
ncbi:hypothetical protein TNCV_4908481 [Trichonephila clavipes]|uniref:Uncharacterized protein n=1 Tax=Trichonephila clavipes TaxID=2585209 RepID=A0A8X6RXE1_TRICX|nr:hypothetical protein TNCV_4908481 [Trichonephila clavipes]